jgi:N-acetylglucosamine malate deacetylase 1
VTAEPGLDILAFGAHPDDVELAVGGTLLLAQEAGQKTAIVHLTAGELGTRGTPAIRRREANAAAEMLGAATMEIAGLPDGHLEPDLQAKRVVVDAIRRHRPSLILAPYWEDLHPDHKVTGELVRQAAFLSGLVNWNPGLAPWRPNRVLYYMSHTGFEPNLIVDIGAVFETKKRAAQCYGSQFHNPDSQERETYIARAEFWDWWEGRARHWGHLIGATHGEPLCSGGPIPTRDPSSLFRDFGRYRNS